MLKCNHHLGCHWRTSERRCTLFDSPYLDNWKQYIDVCVIGQRFEKHIIDLHIPNPHPDAEPNTNLHATMWREI